MKKELDDALCRDFPLLYSKRRGTIYQTCMAWGFECGDGWYDLIYRLSKKLERLIEAQPTDESACAAQVKEKFGTLSFYMDGATDEMYAAVNEAEAESARTCETCGAPGRLRGGGWLYTACDEHTNTTDSNTPEEDPD
jgi:hypothetical protein